MIQGSQHLRLTSEARHPLDVGGHRLWKNLERYIAIQARIAGAIHFAHTAFSKRSHNRIWSEAVASQQRHRLRHSLYHAAYVVVHACSAGGRQRV